MMLPSFPHGVLPCPQHQPAWLRAETGYMSVYRIRPFSSSSLPPSHWPVMKEQGAPHCSLSSHVLGALPRLVPSIWNGTQKGRGGQWRTWSPELHFFPPPRLKDMKQTSAPAHSHPCCWAELCSPRWFNPGHILGSVWDRNGSG